MTDTVTLSHFDKEKRLMKSFQRGILALCLLSAPFMFAPVARADMLKVTGFAVGSETVSLVSPSPFVSRDVNAGAFNMNPPVGILAYCIDLFQTISFGTLYSDYTTTSLASDAQITAARKGEIAQLFHGFYTTSLTSSTKSAAFQIALWEVLYETGPTLNVDGGDLINRGVNYAKSPNTPAAVVVLADTWLGGLGSFSTDLGGFTTYRSPEHQDQISYRPISTSVVPEAATWELVVAGLATLAFMARRRQRA
jgi:hypothetical protein